MRVEGLGFRMHVRLMGSRVWARFRSDCSDACNDFLINKARSSTHLEPIGVTKSSDAPCGVSLGMW